MTSPAADDKARRDAEDIAVPKVNWATGPIEVVAEEATGAKPPADGDRDALDAARTGDDVPGSGEDRLPPAVP